MTQSLIPIAESAHIEVSPLELMPVIMYELGDLVKCAKYADSRPRLAGAYHAEMRVALCDLLTQLRLLAEIMGWGMDTLFSVGEERFVERTAERKEWQEEGGECE